MWSGSLGMDVTPGERRQRRRFRTFLAVLLVAVVCITFAAICLTVVHYAWPWLLGDSPKQNSSCDWSGRNGSDNLTSETNGDLYSTSFNEPLAPAVKSLPRKLEPKHYHITFQPLIEEAKFHGWVTIRVLCTERTREVVLHTKNLKIAADSVSVGLLEKINSTLAVPEVTATPYRSKGVNLTTAITEEEATTYVAASTVTTKFPPILLATISQETNVKPTTASVSITSTRGSAVYKSEGRNSSSAGQSNGQVSVISTNVTLLKSVTHKTTEMPQVYNLSTTERHMNDSGNATRSIGNDTQLPAKAIVQVSNNEVQNAKDNATGQPGDAVQNTNHTTESIDTAAQHTGNATEHSGRVKEAIENTTEQPHEEQTQVTHSSTTQSTGNETREAGSFQNANATQHLANATTQRPASETKSPANATQQKGGAARRKRSLESSQIQDDFVSKRWEEDVNLSSSVTRPLEVLEQREDLAAEMYIISVSPALEPGMYYAINITYSGPMGDSGTGFHRINYTDSFNGTSGWMAVVDLQPGSAREVLPCFDEPGISSSFEMSVSLKENMSCLSSMPEKPKKHGKDTPEERGRHSFSPTPSLPAGMVSLVVWGQDFKLVTVAGDRRGTKLSLLARKSAWSLTGYGLSLASKAQHFLSGFLRASLRKLDIAVLPDAATRTADKWGLLLFREADFLYNPRYPAKKEAISKLIAQQLCYSWLSSRTGMKAQLDEWFKQVFGNYLAFLAADNVEPSYRILDKFVVDVLHGTLRADSSPSARPAVFNTTVSPNMQQKFDSDMYWKGVCIIRLLDRIITRQNFKKGLIQYMSLTDSRRRNMDELWGVFEDVSQKQNETAKRLPSNVTIRQFLDNWMTQIGYPVLHVVRNYENGSVHIKQERFLEDDRDKTSLWYVPVSYMTEGESELKVSNTLPKIWLCKEAEATVDHITAPGSSQWVLFNVHQYGPYRVNYDDRNWGLLLAHLHVANENTALSPLSRSQLLDDALNLARASLLSYGTALDLTRYLPSVERHHLPWAAFLANMDFFMSVLRETPAFGSFQDYMQQQMSPVLNDLGMPLKVNESHLDRTLRNEMLRWSSYVEQPSVRDWARQAYRKWLENSTANPLSPELRAAVLCSAMRDEERGAWERLLRILEVEHADHEDESQDLLRSLTCSKEPWLLNRLLEKYLQKNRTKREDALARIVSWMSENPTSARVAFNFIRYKWESLKERYHHSQRDTQSLLALAVRGLTSEQDLHDVENFCRERLRHVSADLTTALAVLGARVRWRRAHYPVVERWLARHYSRDSAPRQ